MNTNYEKYKALLVRLADVQFAATVLNWDQETYMPPKGAQHRAQQISTLSGMAHELSTSAELGEILEGLSLDQSLGEKEKRNYKKKTLQVMI